MFWFKIAGIGFRPVISIPKRPLLNVHSPPLSSSVCFIVLVTLLALEAPATAVDFAGDVRPVLSDACYHCHGPDANAREADLRLDVRSAALDADVLTSGEMLERLTSTDPDVRMPPPDSKRRLRRQDRAKLEQWIQEGASWPEDDTTNGA